ncbi:hypothetical protein D3C72_1410870 [compost metagenome]
MLGQAPAALQRIAGVEREPQVVDEMHQRRERGVVQRHAEVEHQVLAHGRLQQSLEPRQQRRARDAHDQVRAVVGPAHRQQFGGRGQRGDARRGLDLLAAAADVGAAAQRNLQQEEILQVARIDLHAGAVLHVIEAHVAVQPRAVVAGVQFGARAQHREAVGAEHAGHALARLVHVVALEQTVTLQRQPWGGGGFHREAGRP